MNKVLVLMSSYNGEKYIREQIESVLTQEGVEVSLLVRDDGSTDNTVSILEEYKAKGVLDYYIGQNLKPAYSFMELIYNAPNAEFYALCDQDDVWIQGKLENAVNALKFKDEPALYYHAMNIVDADLNKYDYYFREEFKTRSLIYSCLFGDEIAGCTMVFNHLLIEQIRNYRTNFITMHDGWIHRVCLCINGYITGDKTPFINYRQHGLNTVGMNKRSAKARINTLLKKEKKFSLLAAEMLNGYSMSMSKENVEFLNKLINYKTLKNKISILKLGRKVNSEKKSLMDLLIKLFLGAF